MNLRASELFSSTKALRSRSDCSSMCRWSTLPPAERLVYVWVAFDNHIIGQAACHFGEDEWWGGQYRFNFSLLLGTGSKLGYCSVDQKAAGQEDLSSWLPTR